MDYTEYTQRILASLIISKLWLANVEIILEDTKIYVGENIGKSTQEELEKAESFNDKGNEALNAQYQKAVDFYTEALKIDISNDSIYRFNRNSAFLSMGMVEEACQNACISLVRNWAQLGLT